MIKRYLTKKQKDACSRVECWGFLG
jgi:hypothetical protein